MANEPKIVACNIHQPYCFGEEGRIQVKYSGSASFEFLFGFFSDELSFEEKEFIGLTRQEAFELKSKKDLAFLLQ